MYFFWTHFKKKYTNNAVIKQNNILKKMETGGILPFKLVDINGNSFDSSDLKGKLAFVNFWASWCDPCVREFPSLLKLVKHFKGKLVLVAISQDDDKKDMLNFIKAFHADIPNVHLLWDPEHTLSHKYGTYKLPETFMVGPDLKLIRKIIGVESWYTPDSIEYIKEIIDSYKKK